MIHWTASATELFGWPAAEALGHQFRAVAAGSLPALLARNQAAGCAPFTFRGKDGQIVDAECLTLPWAAASCSGALLLFRPQASHSIPAAVLAASSTGAVLLDHGRIQWMNPAAKRLLVCETDDLAGLPTARLLPSPQGEKLAKRCDAALRDNQDFRCEECVHAGGTWLAISGSVTSGRLCLELRDITAWKQRELSLLESEERWQLAVRGSNDGIWDWNPRTNEIYFSPRWKEMLGFEDGRLANEFSTWESRIHPEEMPRVMQALADHLAAKTPLFSAEFRMRRKDGKFLWVHARAQATWDTRGRALRVTGSFEDIDTRKRAEQALAASERQQRLILDSSRDLIWAIDSKGRWAFVNPAAMRIYGYEPAEMTGRPLPGFSAPEYAEADRRAFSRVLAGERLERYETVHLRKDGSAVNLIFNAGPLPAEGGVSGGATGTASDVTVQRAAEAALDDARAEKEKALRIKSEFLATMSHELRTPLNGIIGMTGLLADTSLDDEQRDYADTVLQSAHALLNIINDILDVSTIETGGLRLQTSRFDLKATVAEVVEFARLQASSSALAIRYAYPESLGQYFTGDGKRIRQVLLNLLGNAVKFTQAGTVELSVAAVPHGASKDPWIEVAITDTGIGIAPETLPKLFEKFSQADGSMTRRYGGAGLGLAISKSLVELMGGQIGVESELGRGSRFWFRIPLPAA